MTPRGTWAYAPFLAWVLLGLAVLVPTYANADTDGAWYSYYQQAMGGEISAQELVGSDSNGRPYDGPSGPKRTSQLIGADESEPGIEGLLKKGESALKAGDRESARIAFEKAAELGSAEAHFALAYKFVNSPEQSAYHFAEAAKRGHQEALDRALDKLFFMARNLRVGNPKEALEVYRLAVNANAAVRWPRYRNIDTVRKCAEAGAFDADAFIDAHGLAQEHDTSYLGFYYVWELAEDAAAGGRFGPPNAELVLHLVCRGGVVPGEVEFAVSTVHAQWKAGKAPDFNICNNVSSRIGIGYCSGRHDLEVAERLSQLSYPEVTDNIWIVNETNILPTCLETVWASGDNYEEYEDQFPSAKDFYDHPGKYWGRVVPISALRTDWAPPTT